MEKRLGFHLFSHDIFVNIVGGIRIEEPGADLGVVAAIASSFRDRLVDSESVVFGEVGLGGEVRGINQSETRVKEAARLGFKRCLLPMQNYEKLKGIKTLELVGVRTVQEAMGILF